jgi:hypothetical protein
MTDYADNLQLDPGRLSRRASFLIDRAKVHDDKAAKAGDRSLADRHIACAATLRRDAGAIALLIGNVEKAMDLFRSAGRLWAELGLYSGYFLLALAGDESNIDIGWIERSLDPRFDGEPPREEDSTRRYRGRSAQSPRQLLSLIEGLGMAVELKHRRLMLLARKRLRPSDGVLVGTSNLPIASYLRLFDELRGGETSRSLHDSLLAITIQRQELIAAAQADEYHWRLTQRPAELIDFDLVALGIAAVNGGSTVQSELRAALERANAASRLPFDLAMELRQPPGLR